MRFSSGLEIAEEMRRMPMDAPNSPAVLLPGIPYERLREPVNPLDPYRWVMQPRVTCATGAIDKPKNITATC